MINKTDIYSIKNKEKIAQLLFPKLDIDNYDENSHLYRELVKLGVGGFCLFGVKADILKIREVITSLQEIAKIPLLFCADMEHGLNMRFNAGTSMPRAEAVGATQVPNNALLIGEMIAREARSCGILWNLAPVADVNSNPDNPIIFLRSFGSDISTVSAMTTNYILGHQSINVLTCAKHFPGHGDTNIDSHISLPIINKSLKDLSELELIPFYTAIRFGVESIMVGHLIVPALDDSLTPASISVKIIKDFLKEKLNYKGLIVTDALDMKSLHKDYDKDSLAYLSFNAGADVLLMPENPVESYNYMIEKIVEIDKSRIEESFVKIIEAKEKLQLFEDNTYPAYDRDLHLDTSLQIATNALQIKGDRSFLPMKEEDSFLYVGILIGEQDLSVQTNFATVLTSMTINDCDSIFINDNIGEKDIEFIEDTARNNDVVIFGLIQGPHSYKKREKLSEKLTKIINRVACKTNSVCLCFGSYDLSEEIKTDTVIRTLSDTNVSYTAACSILTGSTGIYNYVDQVSKINSNN